MKEILAHLRSTPSVSVPFAGMALGELSRNAAYEAAKNGTLGVPVYEAGGKKRVPSIAVLRRLGLAEDEDAHEGRAAQSAPLTPIPASRPRRRRSGKTPKGARRSKQPQRPEMPNHHGRRL
jgi:hypothetical protein